MKKFLALFTIVALLAVAGSAFAANPVISPTSMTVTIGGSNSITLSATNPNGGTLSAITFTGAPSWVTISGNTLTAAVSTTSGVGPGTYTVGASVTETYTATDTAGHSSQQTATGTATITITVVGVADEAGLNGDGSTYTTEVSETIVDEIADLLGDGETLQQLPATVEVEENTTNASNVVFSESTTKGVVTLPIMTNIPSGKYVIEITLPNSVPAITTLPNLYPDGPNNGYIDVRFFVNRTAGMTAATTSDFVGGATIYVVFTVDEAGNFVDTASVRSAASMTNPILAATVRTATNNPGSSGGGCSAGFTALALAVLGGFIATRRK